MQDWAIALGMLLLLGLIVGLLLRFFVGLACVLAGAVFAAWLLGYLATPQITEAYAGLVRLLAASGLTSELVFTLAGLVFLIGVCGGVLLTSRLRAFDRVALT